MKYVIGVLALLLAMGVASADVQIWGNAYLLGTGTGPQGQIFSQTVQNGGIDWQKVGNLDTGAWIPGSPIVDMTLTNVVQNTGLTQVAKYVDFNGDWNVAGIDNMLLTPASGTTGTIEKSLVFDTNSKYQTVVGGVASGILAAPTHMIAVDTLTSSTSNALQQATDVTLNIPPAQTPNYLDFTATFNTPLGVSELFAKNMPKITIIPPAPATLKLIDP